MNQSGDFNDNSNLSQNDLSQGPLSQGDSQGNPFSADLKGDFNSNFGTNTNAVSQIFKEGGFVGENRSKLIIIGVVVLLVLLGGVWLFNSDDGMDDEVAIEEEEEVVDDAEGEGEEKAATAEEEKKEEGESKPAVTEAEALPSPVEPAPSPTMAAVASYMPAGTEPPSLSSPGEGAVRSYDETLSDAEFSWSGSPGGWIMFSRNSNMSPVAFKERVQGNSFTFRKPYPGVWYWKVRNGAGSSSVRSFRIEAPPRRVLAISAPTSGGTLAGNGGTVTWTGDRGVAYYRIEVSNSGWANPMYRFATSATQLQIQNVPAGQYQLRLGAFSEVSGRWEYTEPMGVTIQ